jgi:hypothetical protein
MSGRCYVIVKWLVGAKYYSQDEVPTFYMIDSYQTPHSQGTTCTA